MRGTRTPAADLTVDVIVEFHGELTGDVDIDAERGAVLARLTRIVRYP